MSDSTFGPIPIIDPPLHPTRKMVEILPTSVKSGPNSWDDVTSDMFGPTWDYELENHISLWVITPVSKAAQQWIYRFLPEGLPRYGANGVLVDAIEVNTIVKRMTACGLMSPGEYRDAMNECDAIMNQGVE
jgi:hypothetical protein